MTAQATDTLTAKRVFGEPYEKNGMTVVPVAKVMGGAGGKAARVLGVIAAARGGCISRLVGCPPVIVRFVVRRLPR